MNLAKVAMLIVIPALAIAARFLLPPEYAGPHSLVPAIFGFLATAIGCFVAVAVHGRRVARMSLPRAALVAIVLPAILLLLLFPLAARWALASMVGIAPVWCGLAAVTCWLLLYLASFSNQPTSPPRASKR